MTRVKKGTTANKTRKNKLAMAKGYRFGRKSKERLANEAIKHAGRNALRDRRKKKSDFRGLWITRLNAALRPLGFSYSKFIDAMNKKEVGINRKVLSEIARENPKSFERIVEKIK